MIEATRAAAPRWSLEPTLRTVRKAWDRDLLWPTVFVLLNAITFLIVQPGVNDLWAARARADAVGHGVGLSYWFAWFSGGATPASYSILSPYVTWLITPEGGIALAAVVSVVLTGILLRGTHHPLAATFAAAVGLCVNLWSGRVPFVMAIAFAVGSLLAVRYRKVVPATVLAVLCLLFSPVSAAFLGLALVCALLTGRLERHALIVPAVALVVGGILITLIYGAPGPSRITWGLVAGLLGALVAMLALWPERPVRVAIYIALPVVLFMGIVPNGMGSNVARLVWYCLPAAVVAFTAARGRLLTLVIVPLLVFGSVGVVQDLRQASLPEAQTSYYDDLVSALVGMTGTTGSVDLKNYRVEVVDDGTHTATFALLNHVQLARGWETQEDSRLNPDIRDDGTGELNPASYKEWLQRNSVGYVAYNKKPPKITDEVALVKSKPAYLVTLWQNENWALYRVAGAEPIAGANAKIVGFEQNSLTIQVDCACQFVLRVYWSGGLEARNVDPNAPDAVLTEDLPDPPAPDGQNGPSPSPSPSPTEPAPARNWTRFTTTAPGLYRITG